MCVSGACGAGARIETRILREPRIWFLWCRDFMGLTNWVEWKVTVCVWCGVGCGSEREHEEVVNGCGERCGEERQ